jgi:dTDP-glucose 4,6-dehydratase
MKTYLVTGGAGFIGSNYILYMFKKYGDGIRIINMDKLTYAGNLENLKEISSRKNYTFIQEDICNTQGVQAVFSQNDIQYVVHFAAESHVDRSIEGPDVFVRTNVMGTLSLLNATKDAWEKDGAYPGGQKFVHISTDEVYGSLGETGLFSETTPLDPHSPYSASKASSDLLVKAYADTYKMPVNITRCSNNYGPYQFTEKLIPLIITNVLSGKDLPVYGDGKNVRDWLYVEDHVKAIDVVTEKGIPGEVYNIGGNTEKQNIEIVNKIIDTVYALLEPGDPCREKANKNLIKYVEDRKGHDRRYAIDASKIKAQLGWQPDTAFEDGLKRTIAWYMAR